MSINLLEPKKSLPEFHRLMRLSETQKKGKSTTPLDFLETNKRSMKLLEDHLAQGETLLQASRPSDLEERLKEVNSEETLKALMMCFQNFLGSGTKSRQERGSLKEKTSQLT